MRKNIRNSLSAKVFLLVFWALAVCSALIYAAVAAVLPQRYQFAYDSRLAANADALFAALEGQPYDAAVSRIYDFCIQNHAAASLSDGQSTLHFGQVESETARTATTNIFGTISLAGRPQQYGLSVTAVSDATYEISRLLLKLIPAVLAVILLLSAFSAFVCSRVIVTPIAEISQISRRMTALDLTGRCDVKSGDEIGVLAHSLNTMAGRLQAAMDDLEAANHRLELDVAHFQHLEAERRHFFAAVSHELKTPLTVLKGQIENMMLGCGDYRDHAKYLPQSLKTVEEIEALVREILAVTKMESMDLQGALQELPLAATVDRAVQALLPLAQARGISVCQNIPAGRCVLVHPALWNKTLSNILGNALRYSPDGAAVSILQRGADVLAIENTGVAIPEEDLPHLFTPFYRGDKSRSRATGGSGLGLYIVKTVLDLHGMTCRMYNTPNGVAFEIQLC